MSTLAASSSFDMNNNHLHHIHGVPSSPNMIAGATGWLYISSLIPFILPLSTFIDIISLPHLSDPPISCTYAEPWLLWQQLYRTYHVYILTCECPLSCKAEECLQCSVNQATRNRSPHHLYANYKCGISRY